MVCGIIYCDVHLDADLTCSQGDEAVHRNRVDVAFLLHIDFPIYRVTQDPEDIGGRIVNSRIGLEMGSQGSVRARQ